jgi:hypothetical protein
LHSVYEDDNIHKKKKRERENGAYDIFIVRIKKIVFLGVFLFFSSQLYFSKIVKIMTITACINIFPLEININHPGGWNSCDSARAKMIRRT